MAKILASVKLPDPDYTNFDLENDPHEKAFRQLLDRDKELIAAGVDEGRLIRFPYADGYAWYQVVSVSPPKLRPVPYGDAWAYPYANRLRADDIRVELQRREGLVRLFGGV